MGNWWEEYNIGTHRLEEKPRELGLENRKSAITS